MTKTWDMNAILVGCLCASYVYWIYLHCRGYQQSPPITFLDRDGLIFKLKSGEWERLTNALNEVNDYEGRVERLLKLTNLKEPEIILINESMTKCPKIFVKTRRIRDHISEGFLLDCQSQLSTSDFTIPDEFLKILKSNALPSSPDDIWGNYNDTENKIYERLLNISETSFVSGNESFSIASPIANFEAFGRYYLLFDRFDTSFSSPLVHSQLSERRFANTIIALALLLNHLQQFQFMHRDL